MHIDVDTTTKTKIACSKHKNCWQIL